MNTQEIYTLLESEQHFGGVFPADKIPLHFELPKLFIVNTDSSQQLGSHWTCFFFPKIGFAEYFDSRANSPNFYNSYFEKALVRHSKLYFANLKHVQGSETNTCGMHCVFFALHRLRGHEFKRIMEQCYSDNLLTNDNMVQSFINHLKNIKKGMYVK